MEKKRGLRTLWFVAAAIGLATSVSSSGDTGHFNFNQFAQKPAEWFRGAEGSNVLANVLSNQATNGGWPKNVDTAATPSTNASDKIKGTFDNGATTGEIRLMALAFAATSDARYRDAAQRGIELILKAEYPTGGWPQSYPPPAKTYHRHITFNDGAMVHLLELLREVTTSDRFAFVAQPQRDAAKAAFDRGVECIVKCQVKVNGNPTVWCAQHDEITLEPRPARSYELVSLSGGESAGILLFLMSLEKPSPEIARAIRSGAAWYESAKLTGIKVVTENGDRKVVKDEKAPPLWARFYEIETGRPFFSDRDGVKKYDIAQIGHERRNGYAWYGNWGEAVAKRYSGWMRENP